MLSDPNSCKFGAKCLGISWKMTFIFVGTNNSESEGRDDHTALTFMLLTRRKAIAVMVLTIFYAMTNRYSFGRGF